MDAFKKYLTVTIANGPAWSLILLLIGLATGCETVEISTGDSEPASLSLSVFQSIGKFTIVTANSPSTEDLEFEVAPDETISFLAVAFDPNGPKSIRIRVISGGQFEIHDGDDALLVTDHTFNSVVVDGTTTDRFAAGGSCKFDSPDENMIIQAEAEDFAGNISISPRITLIPKNKVTATFTHSEIIRGELSDRVGLDWQIENAETASIVAPLVFPAPFIIRHMTDGWNVVIYQNITATLVAENSVSRVRITLNINYSKPDAPEILTFSTDPSIIVEGNSSTIRWSVRAGGPTLVNIEPGVYDGYDREGSRTVTPRSTQNYTLTAIASGNPTVQNREITVLPRCWNTPNREVWGARLNIGVSCWDGVSGIWS